MLVYAILNGIGSLCFKKAIQRASDDLSGLVALDKTAPKAILTLFKDPLWDLGLVLLVSDFFVYQIALSRYEISVVKPLVNLNLIFVIVFGVWFIDERFTRREVMAIGCLAAGAILITFQSVTQATVTNIYSLVLFSSVLGITVLLLFVVTKHRKNANLEFLLSIAAGALYGVGAVFNKAVYEFLPSSIGMVLGLLALFGISYLFAFLFGQAAYVKGRMSMASPLVNVTSIIVPFIGGLFVFGENFFVPDGGVVTFPTSYLKLFGMILTIMGILFCYKKPVGAIQEDKDEVPAELKEERNKLSSIRELKGILPAGSSESYREEKRRDLAIEERQAGRVPGDLGN